MEWASYYSSKLQETKYGLASDKTYLLVVARLVSDSSR